MAGLKILPPLEPGDLLLLDGGMSTQLSRYVTGVDEDPLWTARSLVEHPDKVEQCHMDFINAGARIILTDSYQISEQGFKDHLSLDSKATRDVIVKSVQIARTAVTKCGRPDNYILVGGSIGPYGACQHDGSEYTGDYIRNGSVTKDDLVKWHRPRIEALSKAVVDFMAVETQPTWQEAIAILDCIAEVDPVVPVWVTFTVKNETSLANGESIKDAISHVMRHPLYSSGRIFALGVNCCSPKVITGALDSIRAVNRSLPLVVYPNSGEEWDGAERCWKGVPQVWDECVSDWLKRGTIIFGGCCRVDSDQVMQLRVAVAKALMKQLR
eukprot:TRINITY_DN2173_c0_g1_i6.p1 TRINITY_DN2173_c0_g1~~TRINITY_DN2173_c0_g1_i6.p1  ORF type:complete len:326 (-),score=25.21 TRINITY_DN2173_c0_g1_i6:36-1013(-)